MPNRRDGFWTEWWDNSISPLLWAKVKRRLSAGRVQSVALRMICDREKQIEDFISEEYWELDAHLLSGLSKKELTAKFFGKKSKSTIRSKKECEKICSTTEGPIGIAIDVLAIFATLAGVATSLGLGAYQINSGLNFIFGLPENNTSLIIIVVVVTALFMTSAITGVDKGIKFLSNLNIGLSGVIILAVFIVGPSLMMLNVLIESIGGYFQNFAANTFAVGAFKDGSWYGGWTIFYWAWWIAWAPFSAIFIARISKGRTIREFVTGVLLVPALASFTWFAVFGSLELNLGPSVCI